jgi:hypothetical protein
VTDSCVWLSLYALVTNCKLWLTAVAGCLYMLWSLAVNCGRQLLFFLKACHQFLVLSGENEQLLFLFGNTWLTAFTMWWGLTVPSAVFIRMP